MVVRGVGFSDYQQDVLKTAGSSAAFLSLLACLFVLAWSVRPARPPPPPPSMRAWLNAPLPPRSYASIPRLRTPSFHMIALLIACNGGSAVALLADLGNGATIDSQPNAQCLATAALLHFFDVAGFCW